MYILQFSVSGLSDWDSARKRFAPPCFPQFYKPPAQESPFGCFDCCSYWVSGYLFQDYLDGTAQVTDKYPRVPQRFSNPYVYVWIPMIEHPFHKDNKAMEEDNWLHTDFTGEVFNWIALFCFFLGGTTFFLAFFLVSNVYSIVFDCQLFFKI